MSASSRTYLYMNDLFRPLPLSFSEILEAWEEDRMKSFELVRDLVEEELGEIRSVRFYGAYLNSETMIAVIEYIVDFREEDRREAHGERCSCEGSGGGTAST